MKNASKRNSRALRSAFSGPRATQILQLVCPQYSTSVLSIQTLNTDQRTCYSFHERLFARLDQFSTAFDSSPPKPQKTPRSAPHGQRHANPAATAATNANTSHGWAAATLPNATDAATGTHSSFIGCKGRRTIACCYDYTTTPAISDDHAASAGANSSPDAGLHYVRTDEPPGNGDCNSK